MRRKKTLKELTLKDNFLFGAVMSDEANCRAFLEMVLEFPVERVEVSKEKNIFYHPEYKGVRLDVFAKDADNTRYNVEMQAVADEAIGNRARYYHSQIDMEILLSGLPYSELPNTYVIFICDFDPFGQGKYRYTFENRCVESKEARIQDGSKSIFLSTRGKNRDEVPKGVVRFLEFVKADLNESVKDFEDEFVKKLQKSIAQIKESREMEERYMLLTEMLRDERSKGQAEGLVKGKVEAILELLEGLGPVSGELRKRIRKEKDLHILGSWIKLAARADSIEQFEKDM